LYRTVRGALACARFRDVIQVYPAVFRGDLEVLMNRVAFLLLLTSPGLFAQTNTGSITGTVHDQQSAVMEGVRLTVTNLATNVKQAILTHVFDD
jgi:hypothetical protein